MIKELSDSIGDKNNPIKILCEEICQLQGRLAILEELNREQPDQSSQEETSSDKMELDEIPLVD
jgi:hypothetical protein